MNDAFRLCLRFCLAAALCALWPAQVFAQAYAPPRLLSLGGAQRALGSGNDALFQNPAGLAFSGSYEIELGYADDARESDRRVALSVADGQAGEIAGGLSIMYGRFRPPGQVEGSQRLDGIRFDAATALRASQGFAIGVATRYGDYRLLDGEMEVENGGSSAFSIDVGILWQIAEGISIGGTMQNVTADSQPGLPRTWGAGVGYQGGPFMIEIDVEHEWELRAPEYALGAGFTISDRFPLRAGVSFNQETERFTVSAGAGFSVDRIAFDVAYRQGVDLGPEEDADGRLLVASFTIRAF